MKPLNVRLDHLHIYDAEQIAAHITRFQRSLDYIQPALAEALTQRYAEALLSWFHKPT